MLGSYEVLGFVRGKGKGFFMFFQWEDLIWLTGMPKIL